MFKFILSKTFLLNMLIALVVMAAVVYGSYRYLLYFTSEGKVLEAPELTELDIIEAEAFIKQYNLRDSIIDSVFMPGKRGGIVINQDPPAGSKVKEGRKIYLTVTRYRAPMVKLPNVIATGTVPALAKLERMGFKIGKLDTKPSYCDDCVVEMKIKEKTVEPGKAVDKGAKIDIVIGVDESTELVTVPTLFGLSRAEAQAFLQMQGLNLGASPCPACETKEDTLSAVVYKTEPQPMENEVPLGSTINIWLTSDQSEVPEVNLDSLKALLK